MSTDKANSFPSSEKLLVKTEERALQKRTVAKNTKLTCIIYYNTIPTPKLHSRCCGEISPESTLDEEQQKTDKCWERENCLSRGGVLQVVTRYQGSTRNSTHTGHTNSIITFTYLL